ncbi:MAG: M43 family zinc metalloprotease [Bacteroidota bacterium]
MFRFLFALFVGVLMVFSAQAQHHEPCASHHYVDVLEATYPGFRQATDQVYERVRAEGQARDLTLLTIPVVIHVVYQNEDQNLSEEQIQSVLDVMNEDFRRLNADADQVREEFIPVVADAFIEFELAAVERVPTSATFELDLFGGTLPDNVKRSADGGSDAWDTERYLNIWVCNIEGGALLGYAYPPAGLDNWPEGVSAPSPELDGVVIHFEMFRRTGEFTTTGLLGLGEVTIPVRGRTITHEIGHYLGLRHIWGDGQLAVIGIPDCEADDGVADTPNQGLSSQFTCEPTNNGCDEGMGDLPDMWENYMDYAREDCQNSFTMGQVDIMRSVLMNERAGLVEGSVNTQDVFALTDAISLQPNPAHAYTMLRWAAGANYDGATVRLFTSTGQEVRQWVWNDQQLELSTADLPAGLYFVEVANAEGRGIQRLVVN